MSYLLPWTHGDAFIVEILDEKVSRLVEIQIHFIQNVDRENFQNDYPWIKFCSLKCALIRGNKRKVQEINLDPVAQK